MGRCSTLPMCGRFPRTVLTASTPVWIAVGGYRAVSMQLINRKREAAALLTPEEIFKIREHMIHTIMQCSTAGGIQGG